MTVNEAVAMYDRCISRADEEWRFHIQVKPEDNSDRLRAAYRYKHLLLATLLHGQRWPKEIFSRLMVRA